ncbi:MAG: pirin family protein [Halioglobus sp.]
MSAGSGIIHSEMPTADSDGFHGFQLWVNLPAARKMEPPRYRDIPASELPSARGEGYELKAIAGHWALAGNETTGPLTELADLAAVADLNLASGGRVDMTTPGHESVLAYVHEGALLVDGQSVGPGHMLVTGQGHSWSLAAAAEGACVLLLRGDPIREPVANYGPFVMNTMEEIDTAIREYQNGEFVKTGSGG